MPSSCLLTLVVGLTILAAGPIQLDDMWVVDLLQEIELRQQVPQLTWRGIL